MRTSDVQFARAIASLSRIILSSCLTVILYEFRPVPEASSCLKIRYFSTNTSAASGVNYHIHVSPSTILINVEFDCERTLGLNVRAYLIYLCSASVLNSG